MRREVLPAKHRAGTYDPGGSRSELRTSPPSGKRKDISLEELRAALAELDFLVSVAGLHSLFRAPGQYAKKTGHAIEQDRRDILKQGRDWFEGQIDLEPDRLVFIDETWTATNMTRSHGRCPKGEHLRMGFPHGHRKTTTLVAGLRMTGMVAPMVLDGPINGDWFEAYVAQVLVPELQPGDVVIMDNVSGFSAAPIRLLAGCNSFRTLFRRHWYLASCRGAGRRWDRRRFVPEAE